MKSKVNVAQVPIASESNALPNLRWIVPVLEEIEIFLQMNKRIDLSHEVRAIRRKITSRS